MPTIVDVVSESANDQANDAAKVDVLNDLASITNKADVVIHTEDIKAAARSERT